MLTVLVLAIPLPLLRSQARKEAGAVTEGHFPGESTKTEGRVVSETDQPCSDGSLGT